MFSNLIKDVSENLDIIPMKWEEMKNQYNQVRDFNWFQTTPSPHWGVETMQSYVDTFVYEGDALPEGYTCPICGVGADMFEKIS